MTNSFDRARQNKRPDSMSDKSQKRWQMMVFAGKAKLHAKCCQLVVVGEQKKTNDRMTEQLGWQKVDQLATLLQWVFYIIQRGNSHLCTTNQLFLIMRNVWEFRDL